jgi:penicillin-binding protein 2
MIAVVHGSNGTGGRAQLDDEIKIQVAGKTGTAQWAPGDGTMRQLAWFTGFLPANDPMYAYAVVYEGQPDEDAGGGRRAAPIVSEVFNNIYHNAPPDDPLVLLSQAENAPKAIAITDEDEMTDGMRPSSQGQPLLNAPQSESEPPSVRGFFRKLFRR